MVVCYDIMFLKIIDITPHFTLSIDPQKHNTPLHKKKFERQSNTQKQMEFSTHKKTQHT